MEIWKEENTRDTLHQNQTASIFNICSKQTVHVPSTDFPLNKQKLLLVSLRAQELAQEEWMWQLKKKNFVCSSLVSLIKPTDAWGQEHFLRLSVICFMWLLWEAVGIWRKSQSFRISQIWVQISWFSSNINNKLLNFSMPQYLICKMRLLFYLPFNVLSQISI